jgi:Fanconi anemia group M protein
MTRHSELTVKIDAREKNTKDLAQLFEVHNDVACVQVEELAVGDIVVDDQVVFERKRPKDFIGSIQDNRLDDQIDRMYNTFGPENSYVNVLGKMQDFSQLYHTNMPEEAVLGFIGSMAARWQMVPFFVQFVDREVELITRVARKHEEKSDRIVRSPENTPSRKDDDYYMKMILQLEGIGRKTAKQIRKKFTTPIELIVATQEELQHVDGVGEKTAKSIVGQITVDELE